MMTIDILTIHTIGKIAVAILVLLAVFLITVESQIKQANRLFACFLLLVAFDMCGLFMYEWLLQQPYIDMLRRSGAYLQMPLVYLYVRLICFRDVRINLLSLKHGLVFISFWLMLLADFVWLTAEQQVSFLQNPSELTFVAFSVIGELQYFFYIYLIFNALTTYKANYQANFANYDTTAYRWLFQLTCVSVGAHVLALLKDITVHFAQPSTVLAAYFIVSLSVLSVICWLVLKALHHPSITRGIKTESTAPAKRRPIKTSSVVAADIQQKIDSFTEYMLKQEPYLQPDISIESLAHMLDTNAKDLSTLINQHMGQNFFNYINAFRIQKAQALLAKQDNKKRSVLQILYDVGFSSKSSFNSAFKKHTGQTPSAYRKSFQSN